jgi:hypothetical protein
LQGIGGVSVQCHTIQIGDPARIDCRFGRDFLEGRDRLLGKVFMAAVGFPERFAIADTDR